MVIFQMRILQILLSFLLTPVFAVESFSIENVALHNTTDDCYMVYDNKVYDFTSYLQEHADYYYEIEAWCGKDMTTAFETKDEIGRDHKPFSYAMLEDYYIRDLTTSAVATEEIDVEDSEVLKTSDDHEEEYSVEISGEELKTHTIQEIADMWEIDAEELLSRIIKEFNLNLNYSVNDVLETLRSEYKFSPSLIKDIAEGIKLHESESADSSLIDENKTKPNVPYNFAIPFFGTLFVYVITGFIVKTGKDKKNWKFNKISQKFFWNTVLVLSLIPSVVFGFYLVFSYPFPVLREINFDFLYWHVEGSMVFGTVCIIHSIERIKLYFAQGKQSLLRT